MKDSETTIGTVPPGTPPLPGTDIAKEMIRRRSAIRPLNDRIRKLREESIHAAVTISAERARLITERYIMPDLEMESIPVQRARAFQHLMEHVSLPVEEGQLIVGIRGTGPKEVPTFPEICCHTVQDLEALRDREMNPYSVSDGTITLYKNEIIPFWDERTLRNRILDRMSGEWNDAYTAGVFTEFMEQRAPGHTAGGERIFRKGLLDVKHDIEKKLKDIKNAYPRTNDAREELKAMGITADAMITLAGRYGQELKRKRDEEPDEGRKRELEEMIQVCDRVPANAPETFWEALQHYWFIHVGIVSEVNPWDSFSPGRLDQHLYPFFKRDLEEGRLTRERAKELLEAFWLKFNNQPAPPKVGITAQESNTYNDFAKINIGGLRSDGSNAVNEVSYLILEVLDELRTLQPNTAMLISERTPLSIVERSMRVIDPGFGEPPLFNMDGIVIQQLRQGKSLEDAREGGCSGCVETGAFGRESYILSGYINLPKVLEITLNQGKDGMTGAMIGLSPDDSLTIDSFDTLLSAFFRQLNHFISLKMEGNEIIERIFADNIPVPFLSLWIDDCVEKALDYNCGGARYNTEYVQAVGLGTLVDSLAALKYHVFQKQDLSVVDIRKILADDYHGNEPVRQMLLNKTPKYGNDDDYPDEIAKRIVSECIRIVEEYPDTPVRHASRRVNFLPTTVHVYFGSKCAATPDGRMAGKPLSEGISPVQGADRNGIAAVLRSVGKLDHERTGGTLLNQKLSPDLLHEKETVTKLSHLVKAFFRMGGHHVQFNAVSADLLREAQRSPQDFQDLMVRIAGYSDYFVNLPVGLQEEIIARTMQDVS